MVKKVIRILSGMSGGMWLVAVMLLVAVTPISAQSQHTVSGQVVDETGEPMVGVSVKAEGTTLGTMTDIDGEFSLIVHAQSKCAFLND